MNYFIPKNLDWLPYLKDELIDEFGQDQVKQVEKLPLLKVDGNVDDRFIALSLNALPEAQRIEEASITEQTNSIIDKVLGAWDQGSKINLRVFSISAKYCIVTSGRAEILRDKLHKGLKKQGYFLQKKADLDNCHQLQVMILPERDLRVSLIHKLKASSTHRPIISPFVGGHTTIADDKDAPSRAFKKLREAQMVLGESIQEGQVVVDLGACPGGWTYVARLRGAEVIAIDRSEVRSDLLHDSKVDFLKEDAFKFKTDRPVDWVVSDIICAPERILELMDSWVEKEFCNHFVFTIKFQGTDGYGILQDFKEAISKLSNYDIILRQLNVNKNEVTIMGSYTFE